MPRKKKLPTAKQTDHAADVRAEDSIPSQREKIHEWADDHDIEVVREYADAPTLPEDE